MVKLFVNLGLHSVDAMISIFTFSFHSRVTASHNQLISSLCSTCSLPYLLKLWVWCNSLLQPITNYTQCHHLSDAPTTCKHIFIHLFICIYFTYLLSSRIVIHCYTFFNMDLESAINVYTLLAS